VGDPKQAIYGWRGGAAALFDEVRDRYAPRLQTDHLDTSWRSAPPIIDVVNRVFGGLDAEGRLPEATRERWSRHWHEHRAAPPRRHAPGYAAFYELPRGRADAENAQRRWTAAVALTAELQRRRPGVEVALLVRKNNAGRELCEQLRAAGLPASLEGESPLAEHPVVHDLLALLRLAEHPGDTLAWGAVRFSPLGVALPPGQSAGEVAAELARSLAEEGYARTLQRWMERTAPEYVAADSAAARRWRLLLEAAEAYDARPDGDPLDFADFVGGYGLPESVAVCPVRVMTIHKAKGLEFEIVILPELQGRGLLTADLTGLAQYHPPDGSGWTLDMPPRALADFDDTLRARRNGWIAEHAYEELCNLYVAVTRARAGLYLIATAPAKDSKTLYAADLVRARLPSAEEPPEIPLGGETARRIFETGDEAALLRSDAAGAVAPSPLPAVAPEWPVRSPGARRPRLQRRTPSGAERRIRTGRELFLDSGVGAAEHGTLMHALFEQFGWWGEDDPDVARTRWAEQWRPAPAARARAEQEFRAALAGAEIQSALTRPAAPAGGTVELWRERKFEIVLGEEWISGCFDRVVVRRDAAGTVVGAEVLDYKSVSAVDENTLATYRPQLQLYIRVLSRLLACPPDRIAARLIFTRQTTTVACASLICS